jgi:4-hydroxy-tetrahydrodipicolinate reductase
MSIRVCVAGVTGWVGRALVPALLGRADLGLSAAVARAAAGRRVGEVLSAACEVPIRASVALALEHDVFDVLVDYTSAHAVFDNVRSAVMAGKHVVVGSSGISPEQFAALDIEARSRDVGVLAAGNFAITAVLAQVFARCAAGYVDSWEIIEYAHHDKIDAPSGTARELAARLASVGKLPDVVAPEAVVGDPKTRGAAVQGTQVHSIRLPGFVISFETILGKPNERLTIRHDAGAGAEPYVAGTILAIQKVGQLRGVHRGLDKVLDLRLDADAR